MIIMASDHRGYVLKEKLKSFFNSENIITIDVGTYSKEPVDYPDFAKLGMDKVLENNHNVGIFICGSGIGMSIAANRNPKIRAGLCLNEQMATLARKDNDANVLCLSSKTRKGKAIRIVKTFLTTEFEGGRHARRLRKISGDNKHESLDLGSVQERLEVSSSQAVDVGVNAKMAENDASLSAAQSALKTNPSQEELKNSQNEATNLKEENSTLRAENSAEETEQNSTQVAAKVENSSKTSKTTKNLSKKGGKVSSKDEKEGS